MYDNKIRLMTENQKLREKVIELQSQRTEPEVAPTQKVKKSRKSDAGDKKTKKTGMQVERLLEPRPIQKVHLEFIYEVYQHIIKGNFSIFY